MLFEQCICRAASRAAWTAGSNNAIKMPMIVITTKSSTNVKPRFGNFGLSGFRDFGMILRRILTSPRRSGFA